MVSQLEPSVIEKSGGTRYDDNLIILLS